MDGDVQMGGGSCDVVAGSVNCGVVEAASGDGGDEDVNADANANSPSRGRGILHVGDGGRKNGERVRRGRVGDVGEA